MTDYEDDQLKEENARKQRDMAQREIDGFFHKVPMTTAGKFEKWSDYIINEMNRKGLVYEHIGCGATLIFVLLSVIFAFGGLLQAALTENTLFMFGIPLGVVLFFSAGTAKYPSKKLAETRQFRRSG